jgi:hypothetical protein
MSSASVIFSRKPLILKSFLKLIFCVLSALVVIGIWKRWPDCLVYKYTKSYGGEKTNKITPARFIRCRGNEFIEPFPLNDTGNTHTDSYTLLWYDTNGIENDSSNISYIVACIHCGGNVFTELLPSNDTGYTYRYTDWCEGFMKYAVLRWAQVPWCTYRVS